MRRDLNKCTSWIDVIWNGLFILTQEPYYENSEVDSERTDSDILFWAVSWVFYLEKYAADWHMWVFPGHKKKSNVMYNVILATPLEYGSEWQCSF